MDYTGTKLTTTQLPDGSTLLAIICYETNKIITYRLLGIKPTKCELLQELPAKSNAIFSSFIFDKQHSLVVLAIDKDTEEVSRISYAYDQNDACFHEQDVPKLLKGERLQYVDTTAFLFKKKFDNIKDYQDRKRKRIEETANK